MCAYPSAERPEGLLGRELACTLAALWLQTPSAALLDKGAGNEMLPALSCEPAVLVKRQEEASPPIVPLL